MREFVLFAILAALFLGSFGTYMRQREEIKSLQIQLSKAKEDNDRWRVTVAGLQGSVAGQSDLARQCLAREALAHEDAALRESVLTLGSPEPITQSLKEQGVSHATRRAAAEYLNRDL